MARRKRGTFLNKQAPLSLKQKTKRILIWAGVIFGVLLMLGIAGYMYLMSWLQGEGFRNYLTTQLKQKTGAAEVVIPENLTVDGNHLTLPAGTLHGAGRLEEFGVRKLHLEINRAALLRRKVNLNHFSVEEMRLVFRMQKESAAPVATTTGSNSSTLMNNVQAQSFESHYTDTDIITGDKKFSLHGYHLVAVPRPEEGPRAWAIGLENGRIRTPFTWLKESGVKSATMLYRGDDLQLNDCKIELAPGHLKGKGIYMLRSGLWKASVDINQANVARLLNEDWRKRLLGELWGKLDMSGDAGKGVWEARGHLKLKKGVLEGLPFLSELQLNSTTPYRTLELENASCQLSFPYSEPDHGLHNAWLWDNIDVRAKDGVLLLRGRVITGLDGSLSGTLSVGIPAQTVAELGLSKTPLITKLFNAPVEAPGYVWVRINLSGTISEPQEDFSVRMAAVLPEALPGLAEKAANSLDSMIHSFLPNNEKKADKQPEKRTVPPGDKQNADDESSTEDKPGSNKVRDIINSGLDLFL